MRDDYIDRHLWNMLAEYSQSDTFTLPVGQPKCAQFCYVRIEICPV